MRFLILIFLLFLGCEDDPVSPETDCAGVSGGSAVINECDLCVGGTSDIVDLCDADEDGYDDRDIQVLQNFIDENEVIYTYTCNTSEISWTEIDDYGQSTQVFDLLFDDDKAILSKPCNENECEFCPYDTYIVYNRIN